MKNFLLFGGEIYYANGGMQDFIKDFDTADEALSFANSVAIKADQSISEHPTVEHPHDDGAMSRVQWWHVFDLISGTVVGQSEEEPH